MTERGLDTWIRSQQPRLWRYLRLLGCEGNEADDLLQEAFVLVIRRYGHRPEEERNRLLSRTAKGLFIDAHRRRARRDLRSWTEAVDAEIAATPKALEPIRIEALRDCLDQLTPRGRAAVVAHHIEKRTLPQLAAEFGIGENGIKSMLQRSRDLLRECIERKLRSEESRP